MIRYNISGCPILCFRFCVSIPMRHFDDLKLHNFTHKLIFWEREIKNFPDGSHFPHLHGMVIGEDSSWCDWKASEIEISVRGAHEHQKCEPPMWNSFQCKICFNEAKMPKAKKLNFTRGTCPTSNSAISNHTKAKCTRWFPVNPWMLPTDGNAKSVRTRPKYNFKSLKTTLIWRRSQYFWKMFKGLKEHRKENNYCWGCKVRCWQFYLYLARV